MSISLYSPSVSLSESTSDSWQGTYPHFTEEEMRCRCGECSGLPKHSFMLMLEALRIVVGTPLVITSGYRCTAYNKAIGGGQVHPMGIAADIAATGQLALKIVAKAEALGFTGIGLKQHGAQSGRFVHVDRWWGNLRPTIWTY